jgi:transposase-like protein
MKKEQVIKLKSEDIPTRERRYFSESARRLIVQEIDDGLSKAEAGRKYQVSPASIYKWYVRYSTHYKALLVTVVEHVSDSIRVKKLEAELEQTYAILGRAKAENMLLHKVIEKADEAMGTDLKKNFDTPPLPNSTIKLTKLTKTKKQ